MRKVLRHYLRRTKRTRPSLEVDFGLNVFGFFSSALGLGEAARSTVRGAQAVGLQVGIYDIPLKRHASSGKDDLALCQLGPFPVNLFHFNPDVIKLLMQNGIDQYYLAAKYNIGFWFWETQRIPDHWVEASALFDEIWVGSSFCFEAVAQTVNRPVIRIPVNVGTIFCEEPLGRESLGLPPTGYIFLTMMDSQSTFERKNPFGVLEAFEMAFGRNPKDVMLVVKVINAEASRDYVRLKSIAHQNTGVILMDKVLSRHELNSLIKNVNCLVSLHRAEGFGLPIAEAMSMGKPVIATGWSANMDYMNHENSFLVPFGLEPLVSYETHYAKGTLWADPDVAYATTIMRKLYENPGVGEEIGRIARADIARNFNPSATGTAIRDRLRCIYQTIE